MAHVTPRPNRTLPRPRWLLSEASRAWIAVGLMLVVNFTVGVPLAQSLPAFDQLDRIWLSLIVVWIVFSVTHTLLTLAAHVGLRGDALRRALQYRTRADAEPNRWKRFLLTGGDTPSWGAQMSAASLVVLGYLTLNQSVASKWPFPAVATALVITSWLNVLTVYAVHYARHDHQRRCVAFPGEEERSFSDYFYLSAAVQTTFGTTDAEVLTRSMRKLVTGHGLLAFVFNTVIVAILVSLLVGA